MRLPIISPNPKVQEHYEACRLAGTSHVLSEMFALGAPPMSNSDREFLEGHANGSQFEGRDAIGDAYKREALAAGVNPKGKVYMAGLASYPGDPKAWVSGRGDVQRVCEERGMGCRGSVNVKARALESAPVEIGLADDIVDREVQEIVAAQPEPARVDVQDLREQVREKRKPHWAK